MKTRFVLLSIVAVVVVAACGGGDVSQAEYDQKVAELGLAQQDLLEARQQLAESGARQERLDDLAARYEVLVLEALGLTGMVVDPGLDRAQVLADAVRATAQERDELLSALEGSGEGTEFVADGVDTERLGRLLTVVASVHQFTRPLALPDQATVVETLGPLVVEIGDEMLTLAYEAVLAGVAQGATEEQMIELIGDVGYWAIEMAQSDIAR